MFNGKKLCFVVLASLALACSLVLVACDGELSDGLPETIESSGDSCTSCHKAPPAPPHPTDDRCYACHGTTVGADGDTIAGGTHLNSQVEFDVVGCDICHGFPPVAPHPAVSECAPCHGDSVTATGQIDWASGKHANGKVNVTVTGDACSLCHGYPPAEPHPQSTACGTCHGKTVGADGQLLPGATSHGNGTVEVELTDGVSCDSCHGYPPIAPHPGEASCVDCHAATVDDAGALKGSKHLNGAVDLKLTGNSCGKCHAMPPAEDHPPANNCTQCHGCVVDGDWNFVNEELHMNGQTDFASPPNCP
jgi:hypothetical protein